MKQVQGPNNRNWLISSRGMPMVDNYRADVPLISMEVIAKRGTNPVYVIAPDGSETTVPDDLLMSLALPGQKVGIYYSPGVLCKVATHYGGKVSDKMKRWYKLVYAEYVHRYTEDRYDSTNDDGFVD